MAQPRVAVFGKLPGHGDFVRRGDPALVLRLDGWLSDGLDRLLATEPDALADLATFPPWCFRLADATAGAFAPSTDRVGRIFPVVACSDVAPPAAVADALAAADDADALHTALLTMPASPGPAAEAGWWRRDGGEPSLREVDDLPGGAAFATLIRTAA